MRIGIVGSGPAGLMAAFHAIQTPGHQVTIFERRTGLGRKLLVAGSSGLNISHRLPAPEFAAHYEGGPPEFWSRLLADYGTAEWISFIEHELRLETFVGTSERYFVREMKASNLLRNWTQLLESRGAIFRARRELLDFMGLPDGTIRLVFARDGICDDGKGVVEDEEFDRVIFAMGGGSWETLPPTWPEVLRAKGITVSEFTSANTGYEVAWTPKFLAEAEGKPLKKIRFETGRGAKDGELVVTQYGLEGTPVYFHGQTGPAFLDLKPDLTEKAIIERLESVRENLAPLRRAKQKLSLCGASLALLFHHLSEKDRATIPTLAAKIKRFPLKLGAPRPLTESISSRGGIAFSELTDSLELRKIPGIFCAGEMIDWHAPTGGFLIQAAVSMGVRAGKAASSPSRK